MKSLSILFILPLLCNVGNAQILSENATSNEILDTNFVNILDYSDAFVLDLRYASDNNFLKKQVYPCASCYLRFQTVKALIAANDDFISKGYRIKLFDCYRPLDVQKKMWEIVSNPIYVADPKKGSIHNRGGAVDITLVDINGNELNMGTDFDFFGKKASHNYKKLSKEIIKNRKLLRSVMETNGFKIFESEWWHYNLVLEHENPVSNFTWDCP